MTMRVLVREKIADAGIDLLREHFEVDADGILAVCIQHEMDHLDGKVFIDHLSPLKRARLTAMARKKQRLAG